MRLLVLSGMHPLPTNVARGTFVADHVRLLRDLGHDVRVVNPLPRMLPHHETRRSTLTGVAKAPQRFDFDGAEVLSPRYIGRPGQASPWWTARSVVRRHAQVQTWLGDWRPDAVVVHGLWPVALLAQPGLYPDQDTKRRLYPLEVLSDKHAQVRDQIWQRFRDGT